MYSINRIVVLSPSSFLYILASFCVFEDEEKRLDIKVSFPLSALIDALKRKSMGQFSQFCYFLFCGDLLYYKLYVPFVPSW